MEPSKRNISIEILIAYHKNAFIYKDDIFEPIQVGRLLCYNKLDMIGDDTGENISNQNQFYSEMTAVYWGWKNLKVDYVGLCHYRRLFTASRISGIEQIRYKLLSLKSRILKRNIPCFNNYVYQKDAELIPLMRKSNEKIKEYLSGGVQMIIPEKFFLGNTQLGDFFDDTLGGDFLCQLIRIVENLPNKEFGSSFIRSLNKNWLFHGNMFVFSREIYNEYCSLIFNVLERHMEVYKSSNFENYDRISGYMAELLTNAFIQYKEKKKVKLKRMSVMFLEG